MAGQRLSQRRPAVCLGLFAILFQAILFGWHHHDLSVAGHLPVPVVQKPASSPQVVDDEDGCEICQVLHHLTAATVDFPAAVPLVGVIADLIAVDAERVAGSPALAFRARAPPSLDAAIG
jgi:hypothetical protein